MYGSGPEGDPRPEGRPPTPCRGGVGCLPNPCGKLGWWDQNPAKKQGFTDVGFLNLMFLYWLHFKQT